MAIASNPPTDATKLVCAVTRCEFRNPALLFSAYRWHRRVKRETAKLNPDCRPQAMAFAVSLPRSCVMMSLWPSYRSIQAFWTSAPSHRLAIEWLEQSASYSNNNQITVWSTAFEVPGRPLFRNWGADVIVDPSTH